LIPADGWSNVDILVCTPGRLMDHLDNTRGFTLQHLRFLVVDEADRLLSQSYHKWIDRVMASSNEASIRAWKSMKEGKLPPRRLSPDEFSVVLEPITWRRGGVSGDSTDRFNTNEASAVAKVCQPIQLRKFLVSATLTRDPQKLGPLRLVNPKHFNVHQLHGEINKYSMPASLDEFIVECTAEQKPLILLSLLRERLEAKRDGKSMIVIFTASLDSTHRLARLLQLLWGALKFGSDAVGEFSSALNQQDRAFLMKRCNDPKDNLSIVVCSDGMSRGMDLDFVDTVINYDVPTLAKTYVHRCGRTARASRKGEAISLLKGGQVGLFHRMRSLVQASDRVQTIALKKNLVANASPTYRLCIQALREVLDAEANGEIGHRASVADYIPDT
jgi:ATP-dependent RNA helicase DDX51/DBP6